MVPVPLTKVHCPLAGTVIVLPAMVMVPLVVHSETSGPALATGFPASNTSTRTTSSVTPAGQGPLLTVQRNSLMPTPMVLICVVGLLGLTMVPLPLTTVQAPTAGKVTALAAMVTTLGATGTQMLWSGPALAAALFGSKSTMLTSSLELPQGPLFTDQRNTFTPTPRSVTEAAALPASTMVP